MSNNFFPDADAAFQAWLANFVSVAGANREQLALTTQDMTALNGVQSTFITNFAALETSKAATKGATSAKNGSRRNANNEVRLLVRRFQSIPGLSSTLKNQLGINPRTAKPTRTDPTQPTKLTVTPDASGINSLQWNRNGNKPNTTFVIEAMLGAATTFEQIGTTTKTKFEHTGQTPGVKATYRVIAERADMSSIPSQSVTAYDPPITLVLQKAA